MFNVLNKCNSPTPKQTFFVILFLFSICSYSCKNESFKTTDTTITKPVSNSVKPKMLKYKVHPKYTSVLINGFYVSRPDGQFPPQQNKKNLNIK